MSIQIQQQIKNNAADIRGYISDLYDWEENIGKKAQVKTKNEEQLPSVRGEVDIQSSRPKQMNPTKTLQRDQNNVQDYYKAWDKYDVDADLESLDNEDVFKPEEIYKKPQVVASTGSKIIVKGGRMQSSISPQLLTLKEQGNNEYKLGEYLKAISSYQEALNLINQKLQLSEDEKEQFVILLSNQAQCYIHISDYLQSERQCDTALIMDPKHVKSLYRRGTARKQLTKLKLALIDFTNAAAIDPIYQKDVKQIEQTLKQQRLSARAKLLLNSNYIDKEMMKNLKSIKVHDISKKDSKQSTSIPTPTQEIQDVYDSPEQRTISFGGITFKRAESLPEAKLIRRSSLKTNQKYLPIQDNQSKKSKDTLKQSLDCFDYKGLKNHLIDGRLKESDESHKQLIKSVEEQEEIDQE